MIRFFKELTIVDWIKDAREIARQWPLTTGAVIFFFASACFYAGVLLNQPPPHTPIFRIENPETINHALYIEDIQPMPCDACSHTHLLLHARLGNFPVEELKKGDLLQLGVNVVSVQRVSIHPDHPGVIVIEVLLLEERNEPQTIVI